MNTQEQARKLAEMYTEVAENEGAYFESYLALEKWNRAITSPGLNNNLARWRVYIPPKATPEWETGMSGYISTRYIGKYIGVNPESDTGSLAFIIDSEVRMFHAKDIEPVPADRKYST